MYTEYAWQEAKQRGTLQFRKSVNGLTFLKQLGSIFQAFIKSS